ncbi:hypothetical protein JOB18_002926 [Solea senegalensis]|uniref:Uncharacterized protein n=1 Tax=Solea senegalensis TaxID=28829 RepID=A0AAV6SJY3_SOLSE|nr:hypothetical protein JOB18_002926 [Solea senegalensis]
MQQRFAEQRKERRPSLLPLLLPPPHRGRANCCGRAGLLTHTYTHPQQQHTREKNGDGLAELCFQFSITSELPGPQECSRGGSREQR